MGLKTKNYYVQDKGLFLPEAYAMIKSISTNGKLGVARFIIQSSRENAKAVLENKMSAIEDFTVSFVVDRTKNDREVAYNKAKSITEIKKKNAKTGEEEVAYVNGKLLGWEDDIWN